MAGGKGLWDSCKIWGGWESGGQGMGGSQTQWMAVRGTGGVKPEALASEPFGTRGSSFNSATSSLQD